MKELNFLKGFCPCGVQVSERATAQHGEHEKLVTPTTLAVKPKSELSWCNRSELTGERAQLVQPENELR